MFFDTSIKIDNLDNNYVTTRYMIKLTLKQYYHDENTFTLFFLF